MKILVLSTHDSKVGGHGFDVYERLSPIFDKVLITLYSIEGKKKYSFFSLNSKKFRIYQYLKCIYEKLYLFFRYGLYYKTEKKNREFCYFDNDLISFPATKILRKLPNGYIPDVISLTWTSRFVSSKTIKDLHEKTGAVILIHLTDEAPLTGGCHYPIDCKGFLFGCNCDCPALKRGKRLSYLQFKNKQKNLVDVPIILAGVPFDIKLSEKCVLYEKAFLYSYIHNPQIQSKGKKNARIKLGLNDEFCVFIGASSLKDKRKGVKYSLLALEALAKELSNLIVFVAGKDVDEKELLSYGFKYRNFGFLSMDDLFFVLTASDCFLSTTLMDSGPMMVNYSMSLGTPVVSFDLGVAQDLIEHKKNGYKAKYKDVLDLKRGLKYFSSKNIEEKKCIESYCITSFKKKTRNDVYENLPQILNYFKIRK